MSTGLKNDIDSPQDEQRRNAGAAGKLWQIEVLYMHGFYGQETKRCVRCNLYSNEVMEIRQTMFTHGLLMPVDPGHWIVVLPWDIRQIDIQRQKQFFANEPFR